MRTTAILFVWCGATLAAEPAKNEPAIKDEMTIRGTWALVSGERHGKVFSDKVVKAVSLEFSEDSLFTKNNDSVSRAKFKLHPDTTPKGIDLDMDGSIGLGIYKLDGDRLTILHGEVDDKRPTHFDPKQSPRLTMLVLKRIQPNPSKGGR
jgi:uncharacterized protein (TIGR03067 family)